MDQKEKLQLWTSYAAISRSWVQFMDMKAGFTTALNLGILATLWAGSVLFSPDTTTCVKILGGVTTILSLSSVACALCAVLPRESLAAIFGKNADWSPDYTPISFYGYVSKTWTMKRFADFKATAESLNDDLISYEALEQHFVISHIVAAKSKWINIGAMLLLAAFIALAATLTTRLF